MRYIIRVEAIVSSNRVFYRGYAKSDEELSYRHEIWGDGNTIIEVLENLDVEIKKIMIKEKAEEIK
jgi:hypothetical protein